MKNLQVDISVAKGLHTDERDSPENKFTISRGEALPAATQSRRGQEPLHHRADAPGDEFLVP
jgi:hypothetical protein